MKLSQHFSYQEFIKSQTATRKGIKNEPDDTQLYNMKMVCMNILEPIRTTFERPVIITSGFRSPELCVAIGSSTNSQHAKGEAADFEIPGVSNKEVADWIHENLPNDQLILEFFDGKDPNSGWIHCSHKPENRGEYLIAYKDENNRTKYAPAI
jgi:zinc D-Ala-D-Ala carboxypeptidase|tara:strand:- start:191 stop:649 length:459 start_codon:yes stop_codon:yes gene_type:complete